MNAIDWLPAVRHWCLAGPAGAEMDSIIAILAGVGLQVEALQPGTRYRVSGDEEKLAAVAAQVNGSAGFDMAHEMPAAGVISITSKVAPARPPRRVIHVQGTGAALGMVARAVDSGLTVTCDGFGRWSMSGRTAALMQWAADHVHEAPLADTLAAYGLDAAAAAAEDADAAPPTVHVVLPERRRVTTAIERDAEGQIASVTQIEQDL